MKSSCRWTTIHFHFEVLRTVVKCDCMWQSPSLPVYHDKYSWLSWCFCSMHVRACTHTDKCINTERDRCGTVQVHTIRFWTTYNIQILRSLMPNVFLLMIWLYDLWYHWAMISAFFSSFFIPTFNSSHHICTHLHFSVLSCNPVPLPTVKLMVVEKHVGVPGPVLEPSTRIFHPCHCY